MNNIYFLALVSIILLGCKSNKEKIENITQEKPVSNNSIEFTMEQIELAEIKTGKLEKRMLSDYIECTGKIAVSPQSQATISTPMGGFVKKIHHNLGDFVKTGSILAQLEHSDYIKLQQNYLEAKSQLNYLEEEFKRQGELTLDQAASLKKMQKAQTDYKTAEAKMKALKAQLELIGIKSDKIEKNGFTSTINIYAPIDGYITKVNANIGKYIDANTYIYEIINKNHLYIHLKVFEKDILKIKKGQKIIFNTINSDTVSFISEVSIIGKKINEENHTTDIQGKINISKNSFIPGMYVNSRIFLNDNIVWSLPITSIAKEKNATYIFVKNNELFNRTKVITGIEQNNFVEIKNTEELTSKEIVIKGAYYLNSEINRERK